MGRFSFDGADGLSASLEALASLPEDTKWNIIEAGAEVLLRAQQNQINQTFMRRTGQLFGSLKISRKNSGGELIARIAPTGKRKNAKTGKRKGKGSYQGTNAEVAYILEYGSPRIQASHWMENANEQAMPAFDAAMAYAWDEYLKSKNL